MAVRAKMFLTMGDLNSKGQAEASFQAVYEGGAALQKVSENAIFGEATPNGYLNVVGYYLDRLKRGEEYYIEIIGAEDERAAAHAPDCLFWVYARCCYQSDRSPDRPNLPISFRYVNTTQTPEPTIDLRLAVVNPPAVEWLAENPFVKVGIRLALGRRSDAEIAAREAHLVEYEAFLRQCYARGSHHAGQTEADYVEAGLAPYRRKLAIAKGEEVT